jgi:hypothetical protein
MLAVSESAIVERMEGVLSSLVRHGCRFVVIGSTARMLDDGALARAHPTRRVA